MNRHFLILSQALSMEVNEQEEYVQTMVESYGYCLIYLKLFKKALELEGVYSVFPAGQISYSLWDWCT